MSDKYVAKKAKSTRKHKPGTVKGPHSAIRKSCKQCKHSHSKNIDRFHSVGSFCRTHRTTAVGKKYCSQRKKAK